MMNVSAALRDEKCYKQEFLAYSLNLQMLHEKFLVFEPASDICTMSTNQSRLPSRASL